MIERVPSNSPASEDIDGKSQTRNSEVGDAELNSERETDRQQERGCQLGSNRLPKTQLAEPEPDSYHKAAAQTHVHEEADGTARGLSDVPESYPNKQPEAGWSGQSGVSQQALPTQAAEVMSVHQGSVKEGGRWRPIAICLALALTLALGMLMGEHFGGKNRTGSKSSELSDKAAMDISQLSHAAASAAVPNAIADIVARVAPSVVTVSLHANNKDNQNPFFQLPFGSDEGMDQASPPQQTSLGTGVIITSDGYIVTSAHVLRPGSTIKVTTQDHRAFKAEIVGRDDFSDIAVLQIKSTDLPSVRFGDVHSLRPGDWAIAIGSPFGYDYTVTLGVISALNRSVEDANVRSKVDFIQTDAAINPGNSGGPLLNIKGEVIGINDAIHMNASRIGFAIPADEVQKVANELIKHGEIARPYLGVWMEDTNPMFKSRFNIPSDVRGVQISRTVLGGPFDKAGLGVADVIQTVDGQLVSSAAEVRRLMRDRKPGDEIEIQVWRKGNRQVRKVTIGKYPSAGINLPGSAQK